MKRYVSAALVFLGLASLPARGEAPAPHLLWKGEGPFPAANDLAPAPGMTHHVIHRAVEGEYQFALGVALAFHGDTLWASWGASRVDENDSGSILAGSTSTDFGKSWGPLQAIAPGAPGPDSHSHGVFLNHGGTLWAFAARADYVAGGHGYPGLRTEAFRLERGAWTSQGIVARDNFWPLTEPQRTGEGHYIMGGLIVDPENGWPNADAAVAISDGANILQWTPVPIPTGGQGKYWGETALIVEDDAITALVRYGEKPIALASFSTDGGKTWTPLRDTNLPNANAKIDAGKLSTGHWYAILNVEDRNTLAILIGEPGGRGFSRAWSIRSEPSHEPRFPGRGKRPQWAYPYAIERDGNLYVGYAISKEDCGLSVLPVGQLVAE